MSIQCALSAVHIRLYRQRPRLHHSHYERRMWSQTYICTGHVIVLTQTHMVHNNTFRNRTPTTHSQARTDRLTHRHWLHHTRTQALPTPHAHRQTDTQRNCPHKWLTSSLMDPFRHTVLLHVPGTASRKYRSWDRKQKKKGKVRCVEKYFHSELFSLNKRYYWYLMWKEHTEKV